MDASAELRAGAPTGRAPGSGNAASLVRSLSIAVLLQWAGAGALLPLLPLYVKDHGGSDAVVGSVMAAYFASAFVFQYGAGRLSDRLGRMPVLIGGLVVYALGSLLFLVRGPAPLDVVFRALQGAGAGGAMVAALAMISHAVPLTQRGRATGLLYGAELGGLAIGPVVGSLAGVAAMSWLFVAAAVASLVAIGPVLVARAAARAAEEPVPGSAETPRRPASRESGESRELAASGAARPPAADGGGGMSRASAERAVWGALLAAAMIGVMSGVYESCWTLLMTRHGAAQWEIGVSWTLFALPFALLSRPAGWLADHFDRRWLAVGSLAWSVAFLATYPFLPGFVPLMVLGIWESLGLSITLPACQSLLGQGTSPERHGHAQGLFAASQTGTTALAAACAGGLFGIAPWAPFVGGAVCCALVATVVVVVWWHVPGRVRESGAATVCG